MNRLVGLCVVAALLTVIAAAVFAAEKEKPPVVNWRSFWEEGLSEAQMRNVPIFITFHKDG